MKTILITGASSGIGYDVAKLAAYDGWDVYACGRNRHRLRELAHGHINIKPLAFDITDIDACKQAFADIQPDVVILNAGVCEYVEIDTWDSTLFRRVFEANFFGVVNCLEVLLPKLNLKPNRELKQGTELKPNGQLKQGSQLIFVDSLARLLPFSMSQAYGASKAAVHYLAKSTEVDLKGSGIDVQTVSPGFVKTPLTDKNTFSMPMRVSSDYAAQAILKAVKSRKKNVYFPFVFSMLIRFLSRLPLFMQVALCHKFKKKS